MTQGPLIVGDADDDADIALLLVARSIMNRGRGRRKTTGQLHRANVVYMPGRKFGSTGDEGTTWAINCYLPAIVCKKYRDSRDRRVLDRERLPVDAPRDRRPDGRPTPPNPVGEYGMSALGRERMFELLLARRSACRSRSSG